MRNLGCPARRSIAFIAEKLGEVVKSGVHL